MWSPPFSRPTRRRRRIHINLADFYAPVELILASITWPRFLRPALADPPAGALFSNDLKFGFGPHWLLLERGGGHSGQRNFFAKLTRGWAGCRRASTEAPVTFEATRPRTLSEWLRHQRANRQRRR